MLWLMQSTISVLYKHEVAEQATKANAGILGSPYALQTIRHSFRLAWARRAGDVDAGLQLRVLLRREAKVAGQRECREPAQEARVECLPADVQPGPPALQGLASREPWEGSRGGHMQ